MKISGRPVAIDSAKPLQLHPTTPCSAGNGTSALAAKTTDYAGGPHTVTVTAYGAAGNVSTASSSVGAGG